MQYLNLDALLKNVDSKYTLCVASAKRARELGEYFSAKRKMERADAVAPLVESESENPLEVALQEIKEGKIGYERENDSYK